MRWRDLFSLPRIISGQASMLLTHEATVNSLRDMTRSLKDRVQKYEGEQILLHQKVLLMEKRFTAQPEKNEIEETGPEEIEITEDFRVPIVDGVKYMYEGEDPKKARSVKLYGPTGK